MAIKRAFLAGIKLSLGFKLITTGNGLGQNAHQEIQDLTDITDQEETLDNVRERLWGN